MTKKGFTLVEVLVVVVVAAVVTAFAVPAYKKAQARNKKMAASSVLLELTNAYRSLQADYPDVTLGVETVSPIADDLDFSCSTVSNTRPGTAWYSFAYCNNYVRRISKNEYGGYTFNIGPNASCGSCSHDGDIGCMSGNGFCLSVNQAGLLQEL